MHAIKCIYIYLSFCLKLSNANSKQLNLMRALKFDAGGDGKQAICLIYKSSKNLWHYDIACMDFW